MNVALTASDAALHLPVAALARLMPLHLWLDAVGRILSMGPTLARVAGGGLGQPLDLLFALRRPARLGLVMQGGRVELLPRQATRLALQGLAVPLPDGGALLNLSFGPALTKAVRDLSLTEADFAPTDLAVELLWLVEANAAVSGELRNLNRRLQGAQAAAQEQALTDPLTGLRNRRALETALADHCAGSEGFVLMQMDLDHFKQVNDTLGHAAGDHVLVEAARVLTQETRAGDTVARMGGDEFVLLLSGVADAALALQVADRILRRLSRPIPFEGTPCRIGSSAGLVLVPPASFPCPDAVLRQSDDALYAAKRGGRGQHVLRVIDLPGQVQNDDP